ncbi:hypothetical protein BDK51DRAFT_37243 [Blyttiomyces helicus]|uniref:Uncharacterized protein n=1 Tax=Blyttiomyces helicus TaxID=388810 RepID=A0A4P9VZA3_9FUNG|nr:hypothetical protein BDK51DRAFT_37243 [Blyttiomyces helicus]|eukprot:RKO83146.1 hypothetical protein BDK51DRAFT_37243 [Blyttiomyces helicus]
MRHTPHLAMEIPPNHPGQTNPNPTPFAFISSLLSYSPPPPNFFGRNSYSSSYPSESGVSELSIGQRLRALAPSPGSSRPSNMTDGYLEKAPAVLKLPSALLPFPLPSQRFYSHHALIRPLAGSGGPTTNTSFPPSLPPPSLRGIQRLAQDRRQFPLFSALTSPSLSPLATPPPFLRNSTRAASICPHPSSIKVKVKNSHHHLLPQSTPTAMSTTSFSSAQSVTGQSLMTTDTPASTAGTEISSQFDHIELDKRSVIVAQRPGEGVNGRVTK